MGLARVMLLDQREPAQPAHRPATDSDGDPRQQARGLAGGELPAVRLGPQRGAGPFARRPHLVLAQQLAQPDLEEGPRPARPATGSGNSHSMTGSSSNARASAPVRAGTSAGVALRTSRTARVWRYGPNAMDAMRRTKIVATIGPAYRDSHEVLVRMIEAGMDVARLNFSHGTPEEKAETAARLRTAADRAGRQVAILQDLPGPKLRIGPAARRRGRAQAGRPPDVCLRDRGGGRCRRA